MSQHHVSFYLNGESVTVEDPAPDLLLINYLRSPEVGLIGAKKGCGQGGCGACTVILSRWDPETEEVEHRSINSCLRPVCALGGLAITTVEGTGATRRPEPVYPHHSPSFSRYAPPPMQELPRQVEAARLVRKARKALDKKKKGGGIALERLPDSTGTCNDMNPVAYRLAMNNGTQCGYCSTGFVMNMSALLAANPKPTKRQIEDVFDGNLCRCTGYRAILTGMKTFASNWTKKDEENRMKCLGDDGCSAQNPRDTVLIPFPEGAKAPPQPVTASGGGQIWLTATSLDELRRLLRDHLGQKVRMVHGNTSFGIYEEEFTDAEVLIDIRLIPDLYGVEADAEQVSVGASIDYSRLIEVLEEEMGEGEDTSRLSAAHFMARRTAGTIVRNAASIGGNTMLVLHHIHHGEPFPSDLFTALVADEARIEAVLAVSGEHLDVTADELAVRCYHEPALANDLILVRYHLPRGHENDIVLAQKVALRQVNAHSLVNATTRFWVGQDLLVTTAAIVFGGIAPYPWRAAKTEEAMRGRTLSLSEFPTLAKILEAEAWAEIERWRERMRGLPSEGITNAYRVELAVGFLYKAMVNALLQRDPKSVPKNVRSSGEITWGRWPVSRGHQSYKVQAFKAPVSQPYIKIMAMFQTSGQVHYTHEIAVPPTAVNGAFVQSKKALADFHFKQPDSGEKISAEELREELRTRYPTSFVDLLTDEQIPTGGINYQGMGADQPLFAVDRVSYVGQVIAMVLAGSEEEADDIASFVTDQCVGYQPVSWPAPWNEPVLSLDQAIEMGSIFPDYPTTAPFVSHVWKVTRPGSRFDWMSDRDPLDKEITVRQTNVDGNPCTVVEGTQTVGGQVHFYMETQACVALPVDGGRFLLHPSTQSPMEMHQTSAMALGVEHNQVEIAVRQVGGAYGGKTEQTRFVTGPTAVAAKVAERVVRVVMPRDEDTSMIGKRHPYYSQTQVAIDTGEGNPENKGLMRGFQTKMWGDGGAFYDCSFIVSNCIQLRADNAYQVANFQSQIDVCRTNTAANTAFRSFGDIQGKLMTENAIDDAAFAIGMTAEEVREKNFYQRGDVTPFGQALSYCYMQEVWDYLKEVSKYEARRQEVDDWNAKNKWRKRGIAMMPVKYGSGYNFVQLEQAAAYIVIYSGDGTVVVHQGGVDMGQGMMTQIEQVASYILNVPLNMIRIENPRTSVTPNPTSTGASIGTAYNGEAVKQTCEKLRARLLNFGQDLLKEKGEEWCKQNGVDYWNHGVDGWAAEVPGPGGVPKLIWQNLVSLAYQQRVSLVESFTAPIEGGTTPVPNMTFRPMDEQRSIPGIEVDRSATPGGAVDSFVGFTYSAACSVVEVDILTGETKILSSDLVYDMGWSLNPAIDIGQVEGAFIQGVGYVLTEKLVFQPDGEEKGRLNTVNTWRYKVPATTTIPLELNTYLFPRDLAADVPENPNGLLSSKEVGEPPVVLAGSVFLAVKAAVRASRLERGKSGFFRLDAPATVQEVRRAADVEVDEMD